MKNLPEAPLAESLPPALRYLPEALLAERPSVVGVPLPEAPLAERPSVVGVPLSVGACLDTPWAPAPCSRLPLPAEDVRERRRRLRNSRREASGFARDARHALKVGGGR